MTKEIFYEIYRKLMAGRREPKEAIPVLDELAQACRDRKDAVSLEDWLADADNCIRQIAQSSDMFAAAVSKWLTSHEDIQLAKALVHEGSVRHLV